MKLIKLTFRLHDGGNTSRLATSAQDIDAIERRYLANIPGAVFALRSVLEDHIEPGRAFWVYQAQKLDWFAGTIKISSRQGCASHNGARS
jgi:hypothetical protein